MSQKPSKPSTFKEYDLGRLVRQVDGMPRPVPVYQFGRVIKHERPLLPGQVYPWARDIEDV